MSVMPMVCETVAAGLACGSRTLGGCWATVTDAAKAIMKIETSEIEQRLVEIIVESPCREMWCALSVVVEVSSKKLSAEFTTFYILGKRSFINVGSEPFQKSRDCDWSASVLACFLSAWAT